MRIAISRNVLVVAIVVGIVFTSVWWLYSPPSKTRQLQPLLADMDSYRASNGAYPTSCVSFASFTQLMQHFSVYTGGRDTNGITWEAREVSDHDFTVMVDREVTKYFFRSGG